LVFISVLLPQDNNIYHNTFNGNLWQTYIESSSTDNLWDDGYPSGGNFWSDYSGIDAYYGPSQNKIGSDGIGDTPYVIDTNNVDNYPLMNPWVAPIETNVIIGGNEYPVSIATNTTVTNILPTENTLDFTVS